MNPRLEYVGRDFDDNVLPALEQFVSIPNLSPFFDSENETTAETEKVIELVSTWCSAHAPAAKISTLRKPGLWPLLLIDIPGDVDETVLCYGHLDKQPPMDGWHEGLDSRNPVIRGTKLYGRGAVDDGYAAFAYVSAVRALAEEQRRRPRCLLVLETTEESHSIHLPAYFEDIFEAAGEPALVVCMDSVCGDYDRFWYTTSIRGSVVANLRAEVLNAGLHSGHGGGITPSVERIMRLLLDRIEDVGTGEMPDAAFQAEIPAKAVQMLAQAAAVLGGQVIDDLGLLDGIEATTDDPLEALLNQTWRPSLTVTGLEGLPPPDLAGNVLVPNLMAKISVRLPPTCSSENAAQQLKALVETKPPYNARVAFELSARSDGWWVGKLPDWLLETIDTASKNYFGTPSAPIAVGGGIPFIKPLADAFANTPILVAGLIGPEANAHGPNESLDIPACKKLTAALADVLAAVAERA